MYYCWSCGYGYSKNHTSATCRMKKPGHKDEATYRHTMNGTMTIVDPRNRSRS
jgi:hypothetical protein